LKQKVGEVKAGRRAAKPDWLKRAEQLLAVDPELVRSLTQYTTDGSRVLAARRAVADALSE
jgi:hypothetical protein